MAVDPTNANVAYVTYSGLRNADNNAHVLRTIDGGEAATTTLYAATYGRSMWSIQLARDDG